jgi:hypothetical protein
MARTRGTDTVPSPAPGSLVTRTATAGSDPDATALARPGLETVMSATTGTIDGDVRRAPRRSRTMMQLLIVLAVTLVSGVVSFAIVSAVHRPAAAVSRDSGVEPADAPGIPLEAVPGDPPLRDASAW